MLLKCFTIWILLKMCLFPLTLEFEDESLLKKKYLVYFVKAHVLKPEDDTWVCGGALVTSTQILTAAGCIVNVGNIYAIAGQEKYVSSRNIDKDSCTKAVKQKVVKAIVPKEYTSSKGQISCPNVDIGVAVVERAYNFSDPSFKTYCSFEPYTIEINFDHDNEVEKTRAVALNWGKPKTKNGYKSRSLEEISTTIVEKKTCKMYSKNNETKNIIKKYLKCVSTTARLEKEDNIKNNKTSNLDHPAILGNVNCVNRRNLGNNSTTTKEKTTTTRSKFDTKIRKRTIPADKCQYGHGSPLVTWVSYREMVIGVSLKSASDRKHRCNGLYLFVSTSHASQIIKCLLETDPQVRALCNKNITDERYKVNEISVRWSNETKVKVLNNASLFQESGKKEINETQYVAQNKTEVSIQIPNMRTVDMSSEKEYLSDHKYLPDRREIPYNRVNSRPLPRKSNLYAEMNTQNGNSLTPPKFYEQPQPPQEFYRPAQLDTYPKPHNNFVPQLKLYKRPQEDVYNLNENNYNRPILIENHNERFQESFRRPTIEQFNPYSVDMYHQPAVNDYLPPVPIGDSEPLHLPTSFDHQQQSNILRQRSPPYERMYSQLNAPIVDNESPPPEETFDQLYRHTNMHDPAVGMQHEEVVPPHLFAPDKKYERPPYDTPRLYEQSNPNIEQSPSFYQPPEYQFKMQRDPPDGWQPKPQFEEQRETQFEIRREPEYERQQDPPFENQWQPQFEEPRGSQYDLPREPQFENKWQAQFEGQQQYREQWYPRYEERREPELVDQRQLELQRERLFNDQPRFELEHESEFKPQYGSLYSKQPELQYKELLPPHETLQNRHFQERRDPKQALLRPSQYESHPEAQRGSRIEERPMARLAEQRQPQLEKKRETQLIRQDEQLEGQRQPKLKEQRKILSEEQPPLPDGPHPPPVEGSRLPQIEEMQAPRFEELQAQEFEDKRETRFDERQIPLLEDAKETKLSRHDKPNLSRYDELQVPGPRIDPQSLRYDGTRLARFEESHRPRYEERRETNINLSQSSKNERLSNTRYEDKREHLFDLPHLPKFEGLQENRFLEQQISRNEEIRDPQLDKLKLPSYYNQRPPFHQRRDQQFEQEVETYYNVPTEPTEVPQFEEPLEPRFERPWQERFEQPVEVTLLEKLAISHSKEVQTETLDQVEVTSSSTSEANSIQEEVKIRPQKPIP